MERIEASSFTGPRTYFTAFDDRIVSRSSDKEVLRRDVERKLKILLLIKGTVVCAASHLTSEFSFNIFKNDPILLNSGAIIPALRRDKVDIDALFTKIDLPHFQKNEMITFYRNEILTTVNWDLVDNSGWFRECFLNELNNDQSVLRRNLKSLSANHLKAIIRDIEKDNILARDKIDVFSKHLPQSEKHVLINYRELLYHISGARVVKCESSLPQENYLDYSFADVKEHRVMLSDKDIWMLFLQLVCASMNSWVTVEDLDKLSFKDIVAMRIPIQNSNFRLRYDELVKKAIESINHDSQADMLYNMKELLTINEMLRNEFSSVIQNELPIAFNKKAFIRSSEILGNAVSLFLGVFSKTSFLKNIYDLIVLFINTGSYFKNKSALIDYKKYQDVRESNIKHRILMSDISEKSEMIDVFNMLMSAIKENIPVIY